jgi:hypothetical protein
MDVAPSPLLQARVRGLPAVSLCKRPAMSLHPPVQITDRRVAVGGAEAHFYNPWGCIHPGELGMEIRRRDGA